MFVLTPCSWLRRYLCRRLTASESEVAEVHRVAYEYIFVCAVVEDVVAAGGEYLAAGVAVFLGSFPFELLTFAEVSARVVLIIEFILDRSGVV